MVEFRNVAFHLQFSSSHLILRCWLSSEMKLIMFTVRNRYDCGSCVYSWAMSMPKFLDNSCESYVENNEIKSGEHSRHPLRCETYLSSAISATYKWENLAILCTLKFYINGVLMDPSAIGIRIAGCSASNAKPQSK